MILDRLHSYVWNFQNNVKKSSVKLVIYFILTFKKVYYEF